MEDFIEDQIKRNIANRVFIEKSMGKDISDEACLDMLEKAGKKAQLGEVRTWGGKEYIKTPKGWRPKPKGFKEGEKKETTPKGNPVMKPEKVTPKNVTDKLKVGDRVMYNGKEMILTRISRDGRFQNGIEMKFAKEGETTPTGSKTKTGNMMYVTPVKSTDEKGGFVPLFGGNEGRIIDTKSNGDLVVEYRREGEKNWTDTVKVGSTDYEYLTDASRAKEGMPGDLFPEKVDVGSEVKVKVNGKEYTVKHQYDKEDKYGKYSILENGKQVMISDYGAGAKFHGYDFDGADKAYEGVKRFLKTGKLK